MLLKNKNKTIYLTFDVEPFWTHIPVVYPRKFWDEINDDSELWTRNFIDFCTLRRQPATFFIVGEWARRHPEIVEAISDNELFEIGSHSYWHEDLAKKTSSEFITDVSASKKILEEITDREITRFRAPSFSLLPNQLFLLQDLGFSIDSSITSAVRIYGNQNEKIHLPPNIKEYYFRGCNAFGKEFTLLGGGYLRLLPECGLRFLTKFDLGNMIYLHPHDLPPKMQSYDKFSKFTNLRKTVRVGNMFNKIDILRQNFKLLAF